MDINEAIKHCREKSCNTECGREHEQLAEWLEELQRYREQAAQWISVKDRLPEETGNYIVWVGYGTNIYSYFKPSNCWMTGVLVTKIVTHWMPLPEPPKDDE